MRISEHTFPSWDGTELFYRAASPDTPADGALLLFHRGHEHSGRLMGLVDALAGLGLHVFAWDQRGHGESPGPRGYAESVAVLVRDADAFVRAISERHGIAVSSMVALGYSVGGVVAATWVHDYAPPLRGLVLVAPAFKVRLYVPFALPLMRLRLRFGPFTVKSYVKSRFVTHDPVEQRAYDEDPKIFREIAANLLVDLYDTSDRLIRDAGAIVAPALVLSAGADLVVDVRDQRRFFDGLSSPVKEWHLLHGFYHAVLHEEGRETAFALIRDFVRERFAGPPVRPSLLAAHRSSHTQREVEELANPLPPLSPRRLAFAFQRLALRTAGRLGEGIRLGWKTGFDSGETLDYVYRDTPSGALLVGRWIDRAYLDAIGWRGIRQRRVHLQTRLKAAIGELSAAGRPVRVLDVACGGGRYVLTALKECGVPVEARLRDWSESALQRGRELARELGLPNVTFERGDAFDRAALAALAPRPTLAIVSGLYELFPDNEPVLASLRGLADAMEPGGFLVYTGQPWHPQIEMIARVLVNRDGRPWVMRRRTQAEMDQLVEAAGFAKTGMDVDRWGIFTVSVARRV